MLASFPFIIACLPIFANAELAELRPNSPSSRRGTSFARERWNGGPTGCTSSCDQDTAGCDQDAAEAVNILVLSARRCSSLREPLLSAASSLPTDRGRSSSRRSHRTSTAGFHARWESFPATTPGPACPVPPRGIQRPCIINLSSL